MQFLLERRRTIPGVDVIEEWKRVYPYAPLASHVVGYMGAITARTLDAVPACWSTTATSASASSASRPSMETELHGTWGKQVWEIDAAGNTVRLLERVEPVAGKDIQLSIDLDVQQYAEQALETKLRNVATCRPTRRCHRPGRAQPARSQEGRTSSACTPARRSSATRSGSSTRRRPASVVVLDHSNGQVMAMASYPTFDNRWFNAGISKEKFDQLFPQSDDPDKSILVNRAVQGRYNLGSTIKPFIAWSAMHSGVIEPNEHLHRPGHLQADVDRRRRRARAACAASSRTPTIRSAAPSQYGPVTVEDALGGQLATRSSTGSARSSSPTARSGATS